MKNYIVISDAPPMDYSHDFVALPKCYPAKSYFERDDVKAIRKTVYDCLNSLNSRINFSERLSGNKKVLIKPNLVSVFHNSGFRDRDYPESTDPRVFEAVVSYIKQFTDNIDIIESSGKPIPTMVSFKIAGYDRIAKYYKTGLHALERQSVVRYLLPKAEVMKEVYLPKILESVVKGEAFYISVPKMKTNLYTGVTLGFKNAMGAIPYFLRERNHNYNINKKLTDLLYLLRPDITVIDGIIGGEGNTPAPVDPVKVGMVVCGNNCVEVDRAVTYMMGFDPDENILMREAVKRGFNDPNVEIIGNLKITSFRPAKASIMCEDFRKLFPNILPLAGHTKNNAPAVTDINKVTPDMVLALEQACNGGCLPSIRTGFDYVNYAFKPNYKCKFAIIIGSGIKLNNTIYWFDHTGRPYSLEDIKNLNIPRLSMGNCPGPEINKLCEYTTPGCCDPLKCVTTICKASGTKPPLLTKRNSAFIPLVLGLIGTYLARCSHIRKENWVDCPRHHEDKIFEIPDLSEEDMLSDYIPCPLPPMTKEIKKQCLKDQMSLLDISCLL